MSGLWEIGRPESECCHYPIERPAVWYGEELLSRNDWLHKLSESEVEELAETAATELEEITKHSFRPPTLSGRLSRIQDSLVRTVAGAAMIRGFPILSSSEEDATTGILGVLFSTLARRSHKARPASGSSMCEMKAFQMVIPEYAVPIRGSD